MPTCFDMHVKQKEIPGTRYSVRTLIALYLASPLFSAVTPCNAVKVFRVAPLPTNAAECLKHSSGSGEPRLRRALSSRPVWTSNNLQGDISTSGNNTSLTFRTRALMGVEHAGGWWWLASCFLPWKPWTVAGSGREEDRTCRLSGYVQRTKGSISTTYRGSRAISERNALSLELSSSLKEQGTAFSCGRTR